MAQKQRFRDIKKGKIKENGIKEKKRSRAKFAPISTKIKAFITDTFMLLMPIMYIVTYLVMGSLQEFNADMLSGWIYILLPNFIVVFLFFWKSGQTPGCRAYAIELVDAKTGQKAHPLAIALRYYFELLSFITIFGLFMAFFRQDRKCLHDLLSGTILIETDQQTALDRHK
jgi:uncharacterized RDD family membrane protein YckC